MNKGKQSSYILSILTLSTRKDKDNEESKEEKDTSPLSVRTEKDLNSLS